MASNSELTLTFDKARDFALDLVGFSGSCPITPEVINVLMLNCLGQMYTQIWDHKRYQHIWNFDILATECAPQGPADENGETADLCTDEIFDPRWRVLNKIERTRDCKELYESDSFPSVAKKVKVVESDDDGDGFPTKEELVTKWEDRGKVKQVTQTSVLTGNQALTGPTARCEWYCWGDRFLITPPQAQDETYTVYGYRKLNRTLFTVPEGEPNKIVWQHVDLPEEYHTPFQKCLAGFILAQCGDSDGAREWLRIASDEVNAITTLNDGKSMDRVPENSDGPCYMNGGARPEPYCPPPRFHFEELDGDLPRGIW